MKAIILNHGNSSVQIHAVPDSCVLTEDIETYLEERGVKLSEVSYMVVPTAQDIPVYYGDTDEPNLYL